MAFNSGGGQENVCGLKCMIRDDWRIMHIPVPLKSVDISARLVNYTAEVTVKQTYINVEESPIECEYMFPIEEEAAIIDFKAELEGKTLVSKVKKNEEAEKDYNDAVSESKTGFLAQSVRPDILQIKVGHLSAGSQCSIQLTYIMEAAHDAGNIRLTIPTTISPKYIPFHDNSEEAKKIQSIKYDFTTPAPLKFSMAIQMKTQVKEVTSPSHSITVNGIDNKEPGSEGLYETQAELSSSTTDLDRDIIIMVKCESAAGSQVLVEQGEESSVLMLSLVPNLQVTAEPELDIVFLVDCSGSMHGSSIKLARDAMNILLHSLPHTAHFNVVRFGSRHETLFPSSVPYTDDSLGMARAAMAKMDANLGGTEILTPLKMLLNEKTKFPRRVFVLTDGSVSNSMECLKVARRHNKNTKVFALGIGASADRHLVKGLARAGMGSSEFTVEGEMIAPKVIKQLKHCLQPNLANVKLHWGENMDTSNSCQAPGTIPALFTGTRIQVFRLIDLNTSVPDKVKISAEITSSKENYSEEIMVGSSKLKGNLLHKMFARKIIQDLEEREEEEEEEEEAGSSKFKGNLLHKMFARKNTQDLDKEKAEVKEIITELAIKYQLMSKYTSMVAVDTKENKSSLPMQSRSIHNQVPRGFHGFGFGAGGALRGGAPMMLCAAAAPPPPPARMARNFMAKKKKNMVSYFCAPSSPQYAPTSPGANSLFGDESLDSLCAKEESFEEEVTASPLDRVLALISLQSAEGGFADQEKIVKILNIEEGAINNIVKESGVDRSQVLTILVVQGLNIRFQEFKSSWELVVDKAEAFLKKKGFSDDDIRNKINLILSA